MNLNLTAKEPDMKKNDVFPSKYLKSEDIEGREPLVVIDRIVMEELTDGERKPVMYFRDKKKGMIVNRTNWMACEFLYGEESDDWAGKEVTLFVAPVTTPSGKPTRGLRIRGPARMRNGGQHVPRKYVKQAQDEPPPRDDFDDAGEPIPF
jgi:hypothetical protein